MATLVYSTESVDTSAILLSQALDALFTKLPHDNKDAEDDITKALKDPNTNIIMYGPVTLPEWLEFDETRMFNKPAQTKKTDLLSYLQQSGVGVVKYYAVNEETSYTSIRDKIGSSKFDVATKNNMQIVGTVSSAKEFNDLRKKVAWACAHYPPVKKVRAFFGSPDVVCKGIVGITFTEKRKLSFKEALMYGAGEDAKAHVNNLFESGLLNDGMGDGFMAWSEERCISNKDMALDSQETFEKYQSNILRVGDLLYHNTKMDFFAVDINFASDTEFKVANITSSPSLQADAVLEMVSAYFANLISFGRSITKEQLIEVAESFTVEQMALLTKLMKKEKMLVDKLHTAK